MLRVSLSLSQTFHHLVEHFGVLNCQFREHFPVDENVVLFQNVGEAAPGGAVFAQGGVSANKPQRAEVALLVAAVAVGVAVGLEQGLAGRG